MDARVASAAVQCDLSADEPLQCVIDLDTSSAPPAEQFDVFRTWYTDIVDVDLLYAEQSSFRVRQRIWQLGDLALAAIEFPETAYRIRWKHRARPLLDHWILSVPFPRFHGGAMAAGEPHLRCLALPDKGTVQDDRMVLLYLPRSSLAVSSSRAEADITAVRFLADYMLLLYRSLPDLKAGDIPHIVTTTASLFATVLKPSGDDPAAAQGPLDAMSVARITQVIMDRLGDRDLTPEKLCRAVGVSRSRLYRIFEPAGGVSNYIRRRRLLKTRDALTDPSDKRTIAGIAEEWNFSDASTYSRMFKLEFGMSPTEARELGWLGIKHPSWLSVGPIENAGSLADLLIANSLGLSHSPNR